MSAYGYGNLSNEEFVTFITDQFNRIGAYVYRVGEQAADFGTAAKRIVFLQRREACTLMVEVDRRRCALPEDTYLDLLDLHRDVTSTCSNTWATAHNHLNP